MTGFDRRRRVGIENKLRYAGRGWIQRHPLRPGHLPGRRARRRRARVGRGLRNGRGRTRCWRRSTRSRAIRPTDPIAASTPATGARRTLEDGRVVDAWVYFYNAPLGQAPQIASGDYLEHVQASAEPSVDGDPSVRGATSPLSARLRRTLCRPRAPLHDDAAARSCPAGRLLALISRHGDRCAPAALADLDPAGIVEAARHGLGAARRRRSSRSCSRSRPGTRCRPRRHRTGASARRPSGSTTRCGGSSARLQVGFDTYDIPAQGERIVRDVRIRNVMAVLPGTQPAARLRRAATTTRSAVRPPGCPQAAAGAPGAGGGRRRRLAAPAPRRRAASTGAAPTTSLPAPTTTGAGRSLAMELARVFAESGLEFDATLVFIAFAGEEQGLVGAKLHAQKAEAEQWPIDAVFNNDMVGNCAGGNGRRRQRERPGLLRRPRGLAVARPGAIHRAAGRALRPVARGAAHRAPRSVRPRRRPHGVQPARVRRRPHHRVERELRRQHTVEDTVEGVDFAYLARNVRVNAAAMAVMALAPPAPRVTDERGRPHARPRSRPATTRGCGGTPSPGAVAYRVFWREAWTPDWQHEMTVGNVTEVVLPDVSIDDYVFGVAAVGPAGTRAWCGRTSIRRGRKWTSR